MEKISVLCCVYNEEKRIERFCKSFSQYDEIIIVDKSSTDKTVELAKKYANVKVVKIPYSDRGDIYAVAAREGRNEWVMFVTASDIVHPELLDRLDEFYSNNNTAELIYVPYMIYCQGICSRYSIFDYPYRPCLAKKTVCEFSDKVHQELSFNTSKRVYMPKDREIAIHHLTHQTIESSFERLVRYSREELKKNRSLKDAKKEIITTFKSYITHRGYKLREDGFALMMINLFYKICIYLRVWEEKRNIDVEEYYNNLANNYEALKK